MQSNESNETFGLAPPAMLWNSAEGKSYRSTARLSSASRHNRLTPHHPTIDEQSDVQMQHQQRITTVSSTDTYTHERSGWVEDSPTHNRGSRGALARIRPCPPSGSGRKRCGRAIYLDSPAATFFGDEADARLRSVRYCSESLSASVRISIADCPVAERASNTATSPSAPSSNISTR